MPNSGRVGECLVGDSNPNVAFYDVGAAVPPSSFAAARLVVE